MPWQNNNRGDSDGDGIPDGVEVGFDIDPFRKYCLLNGLDDIGLTEQKADKIGDFEAKREAAQPWIPGAAKAV